LPLREDAQFSMIATARIVSERPDTRERLLVAAVKLFGERGVEATSMRDLASAAGIQAPSIYNHFGSKEELLEAALTWTIGAFLARVTARDDPAQNPLVRLKGLVTRHVQFQIEHAEIARTGDILLESQVQAGALSRRTADRLRGLMRAHLDCVTAVVREVIREHGSTKVPPRVAAIAIITMCNSVSLWYRPEGELSAERVMETYWTLVRDMLGAGGAAS
jgi:AcrR family transcriptional regulator